MLSYQPQGTMNFRGLLVTESSIKSFLNPMMVHRRNYCDPISSFLPRQGSHVLHTRVAARAILFGH